jgi:hypothetical protein
VGLFHKSGSLLFVAQQLVADLILVPNFYGLASNPRPLRPGPPREVTDMLGMSRVLNSSRQEKQHQFRVLRHRLRLARVMS